MSTFAYENPYGPTPEWTPGADTYTAHDATVWDEGYAAGIAASERALNELRFALLNLLEHPRSSAAALAAHDALGTNVFNSKAELDRLAAILA